MLENIFPSICIFRYIYLPVLQKYIFHTRWIRFSWIHPYIYIENGIYRPLSKTTFFALSKRAFIRLYWVEPFSLYQKQAFVGLYWPLSKTALIKDFSLLLLYRKWPLSRIENRLFHFIALSKPAFIKDLLLYRFIENGLYLPL